MELATTRSGTHQVIVPRKGVLELQRLMGEEGTVGVQVGTNHIRVQLGDIRFTSKLIDGRFPEYGRVIPAKPTRTVKADRDALRRALQRTSILSNEKYRGIRLALKTNLLTITAHNPEQEEAEEEIEVSYEGEEMEVGFNVNYLLDALGAVDGAEVEVGLTDSNSSCLVRAPGGGNAKYVVMPMRL
jgi:DNA polymerase-3 subunit beta